MADTNLLVLAREYKKLREEVKKVLSMPKGDKGDPGEKGEKGDKGDTGPQGFPGRDGKDGINGYDGKDGRDGIDGKDGKDGLDGVGVSNAYIDFDNSLVIVLSDGREVNAGFLSQETKDNIVATFKQGAQTLNELLPTQTGNSGKFLKTNGTDVSWDTLDGSDINLSSPPVIGNTTPNAATFTTLTSTGQTNLGNSMFGVTPKGTNLGSFEAGPGSYTQEGYLGYTNNSTFAALRFNVRPNTGGAAFAFNTYGTASTPGSQQFQVNHTSNAVNYVQVTGGATGAPGICTISTQGSDAATALLFVNKGGGAFSWFNGGTTSSRQFRVGGTGVINGVNYINVDGSAANQEPVFSAQGSDTNISMAFQSKGTGGISLSTGSQGTNLVNGTSVTAITRTAAGSNYTSAPSIALSAPTTAGGVQATATTALGAAAVPTITSGGTGYTVGDILTFVGGVGTAYQLRVDTVSGGVITGVSAVTQSAYTTSVPTNPVSVTGGTGTGATFTVPSYAIIPNFTITNAGSGYVEQPTVTFSGGGGSGAAAYATVGSGTTVRSVGPTMSFSSPAGEVLRIGTTTFAASAANYVSMLAGPPGNPPWILSQGSDTNVDLTLQTKGTGAIALGTGQNFQQLRVSHTASAVNYVQVTGAATGGRPTISAQGSDTNINTNITTKGSGIVYVNNGSGTGLAVFASGSANYGVITGRGAGSAPSYGVDGSDTNIDLALTPKGTGLVRFGTYTAGAPTATGYINIKAADGTTYKVLVGT